MYAITRIGLCAALASLAGCNLLEAANAERPNETQARALGDITGSMVAFAAVVDAPTEASDGDFADMHATAPYASILDPDGAAAARRTRAPLTDGCVTGEAGAAAWDCEIAIDGEACTVVGSGEKSAAGTYSGSSTQTCGDVVVSLAATDLVFDEVSGSGGGHLEIELGAPLAGYADVVLDGITFCTGEDRVLPDGGSITIDGLGALDGLPFDPLTLSFHDDPACGDTRIE
jgi:hypothetical protein